MKKVIILLLCTFCISTQVDAQFGALKKLKQKVENKATGVLGKVLKMNPAPAQSAEKESSVDPDQSSNSAEYTPEFNYKKWAERQYFDIEKANISDYDEHGEPILRIKQPNHSKIGLSWHKIINSKFIMQNGSRINRNTIQHDVKILN